MKIGTINIKKAYLGQILLTSSNAFLGTHKVIESTKSWQWKPISRTFDRSLPFTKVRFSLGDNTWGWYNDSTLVMFSEGVPNVNVGDGTQWAQMRDAAHGYAGEYRLELRKGRQIFSSHIGGFTDAKVTTTCTQVGDNLYEYDFGTELYFAGINEISSQANAIYDTYYNSVQMYVYTEDEPQPEPEPEPEPGTVKYNFIPYVQDGVTGILETVNNTFIQCPSDWTIGSDENGTYITNNGEATMVNLGYTPSVNDKTTFKYYYSNYDGKQLLGNSPAYNDSPYGWRFFYYLYLTFDLGGETYGRIKTGNSKYIDKYMDVEIGNFYVKDNTTGTNILTGSAHSNFTNMADKEIYLGTNGSATFRMYGITITE